MFLIYLMCVKHSIDQRNRISLSHIFLWTTKRYMKSLICLCPLVQMSKLSKVNENIWLPSEYDSAKAQILSSPEISSLQETFSRILRIEVSLSNTISTVFILAFSLSSSYFAFSLCKIGAFDFLFCFYSLEGCSMFLAPFLSVFRCLEDSHALKEALMNVFTSKRSQISKQFAKAYSILVFPLSST